MVAELRAVEAITSVGSTSGVDNHILHAPGWTAGCVVKSDEEIAHVYAFPVETIAQCVHHLLDSDYVLISRENHGAVNALPAFHHMTNFWNDLIIVSCTNELMLTRCLIELLLVIGKISAATAEDLFLYGVIEARWRGGS